MKVWQMNSTGNRMNNTPALLTGALAFFFLSLIFLVTPAYAQTLKQMPAPPPVPRLKPKPTPTPKPTPKPEYEIIRTTSNLVVVPVSVTDAQGQPFMGLTQNDFRVEEDGRPQEIAQMGDPEQVPLDIAVLLDVSASVDARFVFEQKTAADFLRQVLKKEDRASVFAIDQKPRLIQELTTAEIAARKLLTVAPAKGFTAFFDSVLAAEAYLDRASSPGRRRLILVISDGDDTARILDVSANQSRNGELQLMGTDAQLRLIERAQADVQREVQRGEITFYSINPSGETMHLNVRTARSELGMERSAAATGGAAFIPRTDSDLPDVFRRIASEIRSQYLIQYYSNNQSSDRAYRRIVVRAPARPQLQVRAREGYYPKQK
jgi:Ca-activated chloride channel homolog